MVTRFSKMHRISHKVQERSSSNSKSKERENYKQAKAISREYVGNSLLELLSPIQKVDKYLAKFDKSAELLAHSSIQRDIA